MHHERLWYTPGDVSWDVSSSRPGVQLSYTLLSGVVLQAFSDASVRQTWPLAQLSDAPGRRPGEPQDPELSRSVTAFGALISERLSGRREVQHPSGTRAWRNPTVEELQLRREDFKARASKGCEAGVLLESWEVGAGEEGILEGRVDEIDGFSMFFHGFSWVFHVFFIVFHGFSSFSHGFLTDVFRFSSMFDDVLPLLLGSSFRPRYGAVPSGCSRSARPGSRAKRRRIPWTPASR